MKRFLFLLSLIVLWSFWPGVNPTFVEFFVNEGQTAQEVAGSLKQAGAIRWSLPLLVWMRVRHASSRIQIGHYRMRKDRAAFWIVDDMIHARSEHVKFVIPEGFASWQIADRLEEQKICSGEQFKQLVQKEQSEGYLFPATYDLINGLSPANVHKKFRAQFDQRWDDEMDARAKEIGFTKQQTVTLASIIEREVRKREELPLVSAVYHNRLKKRMRLEADPTVQYALGYWKTRLTYDDYHNTKSPYNTYLNSGLPPGPICNPGWDSVRAALWPAQSTALFFLALDDGHHTFSNTYREHTNKVNRRNRSKK